MTQNPFGNGVRCFNLRNSRNSVHPPQVPSNHLTVTIPIKAGSEKRGKLNRGWFDGGSVMVGRRIKRRMTEEGVGLGFVVGARFFHGIFQRLPPWPLQFEALSFWAGPGLRGERGQVFHLARF